MTTPKPSKEIVICAAIKTGGNIIIRGHRHADCIATARRMSTPQEFIFSREEGFITSTNRFVSREEGFIVQTKAGIKSVSKFGYIEGTLFSEDLY